MQSRIRRARRAKKYMFGYLIPRSYKEELECDKETNNTKWADATSEEMDCDTILPIISLFLLRSSNSTT